MADLLTASAHRKRFAPRCCDPPLPVTLETITKQPNCWGKWPVYTGYFRDGQVYVTHSGDMEWLHKMGFFGKGALSRSHPEHGRANYSRYTGQRLPKVISKRRYLRHQTWQQTTDLQKGDLEPGKVKDTDAENQQRIKMTRKWYSPLSEEPESKRLCRDTSGTHDIGEGVKSGIVGEWAPSGHGDAWTQSWMKMDVDEAVSATDAWGDLASKDVWADQEADVDFWCSEPAPVGSAAELMAGGSTVELTSGVDLAKTPPSGSNKEGQWTTMSSESESRVVHSQSRTFSEGEGRIQTLQGHVETSQGHGHKEMPQTFESDISGMDASKPVSPPAENLLQTESVSPSSEGTSPAGPVVPPIEQIATESEVEYEEASVVDDPDGDVLVVDDSEGDEDGRGDKLAWRLCSKTDPFPVKEYSQLTLEEAFFLMYGLGCLRLLDHDQKPLTIPETWARFCEIQPSFLPGYIAYHYYRSKGWVAKTGLKYGADLLLYKQGPSFYHSSYSVLVRLVDEDTLKEIPEFPQRPLTWASLAGVDRVIEHVAKSVLYCYVIKPRRVSTEAMMSPKCIPEFSVKEILLKRWVSSQEREGKEEG
ncbi:tRNA-splicing endonuclease subunit Sen2-like [Lineus longissimus]|uniref:tRNA-splicing endonuclease subunit Sen2-like n=1 Tax=Lineus longissimus TaxID=88925 RepID=UPI002B4CC507